MSSTLNLSSFPTSPRLSLDRGIDQKSNDSAFQSATASGSSTFPDAFEDNSRENYTTPPIHRVDNVEESGSNASLASATSQSGPSCKETPQYYLNACHYLNVINSGSDACNNQFVVPAPPNQFQPSRGIVPDTKILEPEDNSILPGVYELLAKIEAEHASSMSLPQDYGLPPSAFMKQNVSAADATPVSDAAIVNHPVRLRDITANAHSVVANDRFTPSLHNVVDDVSAMSANIPTYNDVPQLVNDSQIVSLNNEGLTLLQSQIPVGLQNATEPFYNVPYPPQQPLLSEQAYYIPHPSTVHAVDVNTSWEDGYYDPSLYKWYGNDVTLPTQNHDDQPEIPQGFPNFFPSGRQKIPFPLPPIPVVPSHYNGMMFVNPPPSMLQPVPPQALPTMTTPPHPSTSEDFASRPKRKREADADEPTRSRKRRAGSSSSMVTPSVWGTVLASLPATDARKEGPPVSMKPDKDQRDSYITYTCLYSGPGLQAGEGTCNEEITTNCRRNWFRHVATHAADEEKMVQNGTLKQEEVHALLWVKKFTFTCPVEGCSFFAEAWRVDGLRQTHMKKFHDVGSQKRQGNKWKKAKGTRTDTVVAANDENL